MDTLTAKIVSIESGMSRNNQTFWRVAIDSGMTLYTYSETVVSTLQENVTYTFSCERKGRFLHIISAQNTAGGAAPAQMAMQTQTQAPFDDEQKAIEHPAPPQQAYIPNTNVQYANPPRAEDPKEVAMRRGAMLHSSVGNIMGGLASSGYFNEMTEEQIVATMIYFTTAIEHYYKNGA